MSDGVFSGASCGVRDVTRRVVTLFRIVPAAARAHGATPHGK